MGLQVRRVLAVAIAAFATGAAEADDGKFETRSGQAVMIAGYTSTQVRGSDCTTGPLPRVTVTTPPANGAVTMKRIAGVEAGRAIVGTSYRCEGHKTPAILAIYTPRAGFRGVDRMTLNVAVYGGGLYPMTSSATMTVTVK